MVYISPAIIDALQKVRIGDEIAVSVSDGREFSMRGGYLYREDRDGLVIRPMDKTTSLLDKIFNCLLQEKILYLNIFDLIIVKQKEPLINFNWYLHYDWSLYHSLSHRE